MCHVHNTLIRGLNSIYLQAPHVSSPTDIKDFLFYCGAWVKMVEHHHDTEESTLFPAIEEFTKQPGLMEGNREQHLAFHSGMEAFFKYAQTTRPEAYSWTTMKGLIGGFAPALMKHLVDEIDSLLNLQGYDSKEVMKLWRATEEIAKGAKHPNIFDEIIPCVLGCADKTYEGGNPFPPLPFFIPYLVQYWFAAKNKGAWRFLPCDMWGRPRPLMFVP